MSTYLPYYLYDYVDISDAKISVYKFFKVPSRIYIFISLQIYEGENNYVQINM